jgi:hypothetical protein
LELTSAATRLKTYIQEGLLGDLIQARESYGLLRAFGENSEALMKSSYWTGARVVFPVQSAGAEPWSKPFDEAAPSGTPLNRPFIGPQQEMELGPRLATPISEAEKGYPHNEAPA